MKENKRVEQRSTLLDLFAVLGSINNKLQTPKCLVGISGTLIVAFFLLQKSSSGTSVDVMKPVRRSSFESLF